jgi:hypothetical protein
MRSSKLTAVLLGVCVLAASQASYASVHVGHPYACRLVAASSPFAEVSQYGYFQAGVFKNGSTSTRYAICPMTAENGENWFQLNTSTSVTSCSLAVTYPSGSTTYYSPTSQAQGYFSWSGVVTVNGQLNLEIQCSFPANATINHITSVSL